MVVNEEVSLSDERRYLLRRALHDVWGPMGVVSAFAERATKASSDADTADSLEHIRVAAFAVRIQLQLACAASDPERTIETKEIVDIHRDVLRPVVDLFRRPARFDPHVTIVGKEGGAVLEAADRGALQLAVFILLYSAIREHFFSRTIEVRVSRGKSSIRVTFAAADGEAEEPPPTFSSGLDLVREIAAAHRAAVLADNNKVTLVLQKRPPAART
jgi:hypothetical protein